MDHFADLYTNTDIPKQNIATTYSWITYSGYLLEQPFPGPREYNLTLLTAFSATKSIFLSHG